MENPFKLPKLSIKMEDPRIADLIGKETGTGIDLIGFPSDEGVDRNGGRVGASQAPEQILKAFYKLTPHPECFDIHASLIQSSRSLKLVPREKSMEAHQTALGIEVSKSLKKGRYPIVLGGGHETAYGHFLGYTHQPQNLSIVNIDAHADVRPFKNGKAHSGSPFRQAIEHPKQLLEDYYVLGLNPASCAANHLEYVRSSGGYALDSGLSSRLLKETLNNIGSPQIMATMDMDVVNQAEAPGVSATNPSGISASLWLELAFIFGQHPKVSSIDISEVNPRFDRDQATIKLAAQTIWQFSLGLAMRTASTAL